MGDPVTPRGALERIAETARWYANNSDRLPHEVDHALCVEVLSIAEAALEPAPTSSYRLLRLLTAEEMKRLPLMGGGTCLWRDCSSPAMYRLSTPLGGMDICDRHIDEAIAELPADFIGQWEAREPYAVPETKDIPF